LCPGAAITPLLRGIFIQKPVRATDYVITVKEYVAPSGRREIGGQKTFSPFAVKDYPGN
jgi:hypothetical protein